VPFLDVNAAMAVAYCSWDCQLLYKMRQQQKMRYFYQDTHKHEL